MSERKRVRETDRQRQRRWGGGSERERKREMSERGSLSCMNEVAHQRGGHTVCRKCMLSKVRNV